MHVTTVLHCPSQSPITTEIMKKEMFFLEIADTGGTCTAWRTLRTCSITKFASRQDYMYMYTYMRRFQVAGCKIRKSFLPSPMTVRTTTRIPIQKMPATKALWVSLSDEGGSWGRDASNGLASASSSLC